MLLAAGLLNDAHANPMPGMAEFESGLNDGSQGFGAEKMFHLPTIRDSWKWVSAVSGASPQVTPTGRSIDKAIQQESMPDFQNIADIQTRKEAFFEFLTPLIRKENRRLQEERRRILDLRAWRLANEPLRPRDRIWLMDMAEKYKVQALLSETKPFFSQLLEAVDVIPVSLALAQAARESGLGSSRMARERNNLFGHMCYPPTCSPHRSKTNSSTGLRFDSVEQSVRDYMTNLNTNRAYQGMRTLRAELRAKGKSITGTALGVGLQRYSIQGMAYVQMIKAAIDRDDLTRLDGAEYLP
ncbi:MAG: glucosaminidase domain-containing protein [Magnetococcus sp. YQC-5]